LSEEWEWEYFFLLKYHSNEVNIEWRIRGRKESKRRDSLERHHLKWKHITTIIIFCYVCSESVEIAELRVQTIFNFAFHSLSFHSYIAVADQQVACWKKFLLQRERKKKWNKIKGRKKEEEIKKKTQRTHVLCTPQWRLELT
jgi:hypothetical protein